MYRIRRFGIMKTATVVAVMYLFIFLIGTLLFALLVAAVGPTAGQVSGANFGAAGVAGVLVGGIILSLVYAALGWVFTAIACAIYNLVAGWVGGVEVQLEAVSPPPPPPTWGTPPAASAGPGSDTAPYDPSNPRVG